MHYESRPLDYYNWIVKVLTKYPTKNSKQKKGEEAKRNKSIAKENTNVAVCGSSFLLGHVRVCFFFVCVGSWEGIQHCRSDLKMADQTTPPTGSRNILTKPPEWSDVLPDSLKPNCLNRS
mmetsp:Transcript_10352/g.19593  ORF Transcript_10352/g.19593 Transcript_10352/m.19593 type:complete len:120 (+) Transcript_10352:37-396(+)